MQDTSELIQEVEKLRANYNQLEVWVKGYRDTIANKSGTATRCVALAYSELQSSRHWLTEALSCLLEIQEKELLEKANKSKIDPV